MRISFGYTIDFAEPCDDVANMAGVLERLFQLLRKCELPDVEVASIIHGQTSLTVLSMANPAR
jgi:hypothetical protein